MVCLGALVLVSLVATAVTHGVFTLAGSWLLHACEALMLSLFGFILFVLLVCVGAYYWATFLVSACQWFLKRCDWSQRDTVSPSSLSGEEAYDEPDTSQPHYIAPSVGSLLSSSHPASCSCDSCLRLRKLDF